jgi:uncharacterized protein (TIGR00369 family)
MDMLLSPYAATMGFGRERDAGGRLLLTMDYAETKAGRPGFLHGGAIAGMLETIAYATVAEALGPNNPARLKPINMTITYMRGGREQRTFARATIERLGKRLANVEAIAWQDDPTKPIAQAQINVMLARD